MSTNYSSANSEDTIHAEIDKVIRRYFPDLEEAKPTFNVLYAYASELGDPALKKNGIPALAMIKVNSLEDRAKGMADVTLKVDAKHWGEMKAAERTSLIDHELYHLVVKRNKKSKAIKKDDLGRPKLSLQPHDFEIGGFKEVIERHKTHSHEAQQLDKAARTYIQGMFPWG